MSVNKPKVLLMADWFEPGYKAGGPIRSCVNFCQHLKNDLNIFVLTTDRDLGESNPYSTIRPNEWLDYNEHVKIFYLSPDRISFDFIRELIGVISPDIIYLNSMYSKYFSLYPLMMKRRNLVKGKIILAPRGMLKESAIQFKKGKKRIFLSLMKVTGLHRKVTFHCTDDVEVRDVKKYFGNAPSVMLPNFPGYQKPFKPVAKHPGILRLLFVGRIHPIKNLDVLLRQLGSLNSNVQLTIIGSVEDINYYSECQKLVAELPSNISVEFKGELPHDEIDNALRENHLFALPTKGENFGHAIFESLAAGRPVVISDQTPWRDLARLRSGFDIALNQPEKFGMVIEKFAAMDQIEFDNWCKGAWELGKKHTNVDSLKEGYIKLFNSHK